MAYCYPLPIGSMYAIYGNIYHQYTPFMLAYIPAPWILWVLLSFGVLNTRWKAAEISWISWSGEGQNSGEDQNTPTSRYPNGALTKLLLGRHTCRVA